MTPAFLARLDGLWRHENFMRLWAAQSLSAVGGRITRTALPMIAILALDAPESQIGFLTAAGLVPIAIAGLFGGGFVERSMKREMMIFMDLARAALVLLIPLGAWFGFLDMWLLFIVAAVAGAATALFQNADIAFLPRLVGRDHVLEGNAKLQSTESLAELMGPGLAGLLIQFLTAPFAIVANGVTYVWSAFWISRIKNVVEDKPANGSARRFDPAEIVHDLKVGWRAVMSQAPLRAAFLATVILQISWGFFFVLYSLFALRVLGLQPWQIGLIISFGGLSGLIGAYFAQPLVRRVGFGPAMLISFVLGQAGLIFLILAAVGGPLTIPLMVGHQLFADGALVAFTVFVTSLRQTTVAENEIARANGLFQAASGILLPLAGLVAGFLAEFFGIQTAVIIGVVIGFLGILPLISPRLLSVRTIAQTA